MSDLNDKINEFTDTPDTTYEYEPGDIEKSKPLAIISYLSLLVFFPLLTMKDSKFTKFHVNQGLVLAIAEIIAYFLIKFLRYIPIIHLFTGIAKYFLILVFIVLSLIGVINAANGKAKELPVVGKIKLIK